MGREDHSGRWGRAECLQADVGVAPVPAGRQETAGWRGEWSDLPAPGFGLWVSGIAAGWSLPSRQLHPCWLWTESPKPKEWLLTVRLLW